MNFSLVIQFSQVELISAGPTRTLLLRCLGRSKNWGLAFMSSFDQACLELSLRGQTDMEVEGGNAVLKWTILCDEAGNSNRTGT